MKVDMKVAILVCGVAIAVAAGAFFAFSVWVMHAPAVPRSKMARLQQGMSKAEVRQLLGEPDSRYADGDTWAYSRWTWAILKVHFDPRGNLTRFVHDE